MNVLLLMDLLAPKSGTPKSASRKEIVSKIKEIIEGDASSQFVIFHEK